MKLDLGIIKEVAFLFPVLHSEGSIEPRNQRVLHPTGG